MAEGHAFSSPKPGEATIPSPLMSPPPKSRSPDPDSQFPRRPRVSPEPWASPARRSALQSAESTNVSHMHLPPELPPCISDLGLLPELRCGCGFAACKKISHTPRNPGREFLACGSKSQKWICKT